MQRLKLFTVDAFADEIFHGNPAAVVILEEQIPDEKLQKIATEMNLSETCYLSLPDDAKLTPALSWKTCKRFELRWFTPTKEVILCGHGTLASAHILFTCLGNTSEALEFNTLSGILVARRSQDNTITLDFPLRTPRKLKTHEEESFRKVVHEVAGGLPFEEVLLSTEGKKLLVRMADHVTSTQLCSLSPSTSKLLGLYDGGAFLGVIITVVGGDSDVDQSNDRGLSGYHFVSRYFAPWNGIPEDPVTGSAHTVLGPYWSSKLELKTMRARQCSKRGGNLTLNIRDDGRIDISGGAITVIEGTITVS